MKIRPFAFVLCSLVLLAGACTSSVTAPEPGLRVMHDGASDSTALEGGHTMGSGN